MTEGLLNVRKIYIFVCFYVNKQSLHRASSVPLPLQGRLWSVRIISSINYNLNVTRVACRGRRPRRPALFCTIFWREDNILPYIDRAHLYKLWFVGELKSPPCLKEGGPSKTVGGYRIYQKYINKCFSYIMYPLATLRAALSPLGKGRYIGFYELYAPR